MEQCRDGCRSRAHYNIEDEGDFCYIIQRLKAAN